MPREIVEKTEEVLEEKKEETQETSNLQSEEPSEEDRFEQPDFGAITDFVELDGEEKAPPVEASEEKKLDSDDEEKSTEEVASEEKEEGDEVPEKKEEPKAEVKEEKKEEPPKAPEVEPVKLPTQEELEGLYAEHREKTLPKLEELFTLTEEQAAALDEQPSKAIPKLAAQMMYDVQLSTYNAVLAALPTVVQTFLHASDTAKEAENEFYSVWPDLKKAEATPAVSAAIQAYRAANPRASRQEIIKNSGVMAMIQLGMDPLKTVKKGETPPVVKKTAPVKPVSPRGSDPVPPKKPGSEEENEFTQLAEAFMSELS